MTEKELQTILRTLNETENERYAITIRTVLEEKDQRIKELEGKIENIFKRFDEYSCIKNDKWYLNLKEELAKGRE